jgi:hypothetical protein
LFTTWLKDPANPNSSKGYLIKFKTYQFDIDDEVTVAERLQNLEMSVYDERE